MSMTVGSRASRIVAVAQPSTSVAEAARLMREHHVGALVVVQAGSSYDHAVGVVTDRDIVVEVTAPGLDAETITVGDIMSTDLAVAHENDDLFEAIDVMRQRGVRRLPILDSGNRLVGVFAIDDLLEVFLEQMAGVVKAIGREQQQEIRSRRGRLHPSGSSPEGSERPQPNA